MPRTRLIIIFIIFLFLLNLNYFTRAVGVVKAINYSNIKKYSFKNRFLIHKLPVKSGVIYKLNTALGYVSVITLPTIPLDVAVGNAAAFSEQIVGKQIFIKPITYNTKTTSNLEIFTKFGLINILLRIKNAKIVTYNLNFVNTLKNVFADNYIKSKINRLKAKLFREYNSKLALLNINMARVEKEKKEVISLILLINRLKVNKMARKDGITLTVISISHIRNFYYMGYQITNNNNMPFFIRNIYLYKEEGGSFFDGYNPGILKEIYTINHTPHNIEYTPYKTVKNVIIFKKPKLDAGSNLRLSFHILLGGKLIKLVVNKILQK